VDLFIDRLVNGLSDGAVYSLIALALVVIYRGTGHLNFGQGEMALFATYIAWTFMDKAPDAATLVVILAIIGAAAVAFVGGALIEALIIRPVAAKSELSVTVVTIGLFLLFNAAVGVVWDIDPHPFASLFPNGPDDYFTVLDSRVRWEKVGTVAVMLALAGVLFWMFRYTKIGLAMRATANNQASAKLVGIRTGRVLMFGWGLAAAIGAVGGSLIAAGPSGLSPPMMFGILLYASAAATLGGLDSPGGAVIAGLLIGVIQTMASGYIDWIGDELKFSLALVVILVVLLFKPNGLFGSAKVERV
jgi:branched-chain amino acid transport system permease protein